VIAKRLECGSVFIKDQCSSCECTGRKLKAKIIIRPTSEAELIDTRRRQEYVLLIQIEPTNSVSARKIFIYLLTYLLII